MPAMSRCAQGTSPTNCCRKTAPPDAAGLAAAADILDVGDVGLDVLVVGLAQRQPPQQLADRLAGGGQQVARPASSSLANRPACSWPSATMTAPVSVARSIIALRLEPLLGVAEHVGEHEAALGVGVDHLDGLAGHRCAPRRPAAARCPTACSRPARRRRRRSTARLAAGQRQHGAEHGGGTAHVRTSCPPCRAAGLIEMPPVSKMTPLPTSASGASLPPPCQRIIATIGRLARCLAPRPAARSCRARVSSADRGSRPRARPRRGRRRRRRRPWASARCRAR